jgi:hypothetical protein
VEPNTALEEGNADESVAVAFVDVALEEVASLVVVDRSHDPIIFCFFDEIPNTGFFFDGFFDIVPESQGTQF